MKTTVLLIINETNMDDAIDLGRVSNDVLKSALKAFCVNMAKFVSERELNAAKTMLRAMVAVKTHSDHSIDIELSE